MQSILALLILLSCISAVRTIQCYKCDSSNKNGCGDPFDANSMNDTYKTVKQDNRVCTKVVASSDGGVEIDRDTTAPGSICIGGLDGCDDYDERGVTITVCCCQKDFCNGASGLYQPLLTISFFIIAIFIHRHF